MSTSDVQMTRMLLCFVSFIGLLHISFGLSNSTQNCTGVAMDLVFVVDASTSIKPNNFRLVKNFLADVVGELDVSQSLVRVAVVRFSDDVQILLYLNQSTSRQYVQNLITNMFYKKGGTNTYTALQAVRESVLLAANGNREAVQDVVMVITDGVSWRPNKTAEQARLLRENGAYILALGILGTDLRDHSELEAMSSFQPQLISDFVSLKRAVTEARDNLCLAGKNSPKSTSLSSKTSPSIKPSNVMFSSSILITTTVKSTAPRILADSTSADLILKSSVKNCSSCSSLDPENQIHTSDKEDMTQTASHEDKSQATSHDDKTQATSHEDKTQATSHEDTTQTASHEDTTQTATHEDMTQSTSHEYTTQATSSEDMAQTTNHEDTTQATSHEETTYATSQEDTTQAKSHEDTTQATRHEDTTQAKSHEDTTQAESHEDMTQTTSLEDMTQTTSHEDMTQATSHEDTTQATSQEDTTQGTSQEDKTQTASQEDKAQGTNQEDMSHITRWKEMTHNSTQSDITQTSQEDKTQAIIYDDKTQIASHEDKAQATIYEDKTQTTSQEDKTQATIYEDKTQITSQEDNIHITSRKEMTHNSSQSDVTQTTSPEDTTQSTSQEDMSHITSRKEMTHNSIQSDVTQTTRLRDLTQSLSQEMTQNSTQRDVTQTAKDVLSEVREHHTLCDTQELDLVFALDSSCSVSPENFERSKAFIANIVSDLQIGNESVRVGLVRYGTSAEVVAFLNQSRDANTVKNAISAMSYYCGSTNTSGALKTVREQVLDDASRDDVGKVTVVITDGESNNFRDTQSEASKLRNSRVRLVWLYIFLQNSNMMERERREMIKHRDVAISVKNFDELGDDIVRKVVNASCRAFPTTTQILASTTTSTTTTTTPATIMTTIKETENIGEITTSPSSALTLLLTTVAPIADMTDEVTTHDARDSRPAFSPPLNSSSPKADMTHHTTEHGPKVPRSSAAILPALSSALPNLTMDQSVQESSEASESADVVGATSMTAVTSMTRSYSSVIYSTSQLSVEGTLSQSEIRGIPKVSKTPARASRPTADLTSLALTTPLQHPQDVSEAKSLILAFTDTTQPSSLSTNISHQRTPYPKPSLTDDGYWLNDWSTFAGITVGGISMIALTTGSILFLLKRRRNEQKKKKTNMTLPEI